MEIYTSDSSDSESRENRTLDFGRKDHNVDSIERELCASVYTKSRTEIEAILLNHNALPAVPVALMNFVNLRTLDLSSNCLTALPEQLLKSCPNVQTLIVKNNLLTMIGLPKALAKLELRELNLSGNKLINFPQQLLDIKTLRYLYLGGNQIAQIPKDIGRLNGLQLLSMGGNRLTDVPDSIANLHQLQALILCDNLIERLPASIAQLNNLKSLLIHKNQLRHLPRDIVALKNLSELSLRENPLVVRFVQDMALHPGTLLELAARVVKVAQIPVGPGDLPTDLCDYLSTASCCVNPKCNGVFFDKRVEHIKFVDFCGKYRVPLLQYLCSSKCITERPERVGGRAQVNSRRSSSDRWSTASSLSTATSSTSVTSQPNEEEEGTSSGGGNSGSSGSSGARDELATTSGYMMRKVLLG